MVQSYKLLILKTVLSVFPAVTFGYLSFGSRMRKLEPSTDCYAIYGDFHAMPAEITPGNYEDYYNVSKRFRGLFIFAFILAIVRLLTILPAEWYYTL